MGATIRLFLDILADGSAQEQAAAKADGTEVSPFFQGGKADWVYSLTTLAAPHNGTTFLECCGDMTQFAAEVSTTMAKLLGISDFKGVYDFQLEQFGFYRKDGETVLEALDRDARTAALRPVEAAFADLPALTLAPFFAKLAHDGCEIYQKKVGAAYPVGTRLRLCDENGCFALGEVRDYEAGIAIKPIKQLKV